MRDLTVTEYEHTPTQVLAQTLKRLYPQNPDIVLGREARTIIEEFEKAGYAVVPVAVRDAVVDQAIDDYEFDRRERRDELPDPHLRRSRW